MFRTFAIALILTGTAAAAYAADVYRYVDAQGGVHYTDTWMPGSTLIKVDHRARDTSSSTARTAQTRTLIAGDRASADLTKQADERAVKADVTQAKEEQCKQAKDTYEKAIHARRIFKAAKEGEQREYLSDADADAYRTQLRSDMQLACGNETK